MGSLALLAVLVILSVWGVAAAALLATTLGFLRVGAAFGVLSIVAGVLLMVALPHVCIVGAANVVAGAVAVWSLFGNNREDDDDE